MSKVRFDDDEMVIIAIFERPSRKDTIQYMLEAMEFIAPDDQELSELVISVSKKLEQITDKTFKSFELADYLIDLESDEDE